MTLLSPPPLVTWQCSACGVEQGTVTEPTIRLCLSCRRKTRQPTRDEVLRRAGCPQLIYATPFDPARIPGGGWPRHPAIDPDKHRVDLTAWSGSPWPTLLITGVVGVGKSMLAGELLWLASQRGQSVRWITAGAYVFHRFGRDDTAVYDSVNALVVDDLGRDHPSNAAWDAVGSLIARRHDNRRQTIVSSNYALALFVDRHAAMGDRLASGLAVNLPGGSQR